MGIPNENTEEALKKLIACIQAQSGHKVVDFNAYFLIMRDDADKTKKYAWGYLGGGQTENIEAEALLSLHAVVDLSIKERMK